MFFQTVFTSLLIILLGLCLCFAGYRFFVILVSIWGFFAGFHFGASILSNWFGQGFLTTVIGWVIGLLVGIFAAALAYLFYEAAVILLAGFVGYELGVGIMTWIGFQPGFIPFLVGLAVALALAVLAVILRFPKILIIVLTAFAGAGAILAGFFLAFGRISLADLQFGEVGAIVRDNWIWGVLYLALAAVGILIQWGTTENYVHDAAITGATATHPTTDAVAATTAMSDIPASDNSITASSSTVTEPATDASTNGASLADSSTGDSPVTDPRTDV
jgi:Domain of unknown function (DUF4203)